MDWDFSQKYIEISNVKGYFDDKKIYTERLPEVILSDKPIEVQEMRFFGEGKGSRKAISSHSFSSFDFTSSKKELESISAKLHKHDYYEMILPMQMPLKMQIESRLCLLREGEVCLLNRSTRHAEHFCANQQVFYIALSPSYMERWPVEEGVSLPRPFYQLFHNGRTIRNITGPQNRDYVLATLLAAEGKTCALAMLKEIWKELEQKRPGYQLFVRGMLARMMGLLSDNRFYHGEYIDLGKNTDFELAQSVKKILDTNIRKTTKNELAQKFSYNGDYLNQIFRKYYNCSISEYNRRLCIRYMAYLLLATPKPIDAICRQLGFVNRTHIYQLFEKTYGCTPGEYRRSAP